jgi:hypothetical protein
MCRIRYWLVLSCFLPALALAADRTPPNLEPLPDVPPPPLGAEIEGIDEPEVTIIQKDGETIEEYRINGELYMMKVTPSHGVPYYLQKEDRDGAWSRIDGPAPPTIIPKWVIFRF